MMHAVGEPEFGRRRAKGLCVSAYCSNRVHRVGTSLCSTCTKRRQKEINPLAYCFNTLKQNARRRGKEFLLTKDEFSVFCERTKYLELKGRFGNMYTIDRVDASRGYSLDNIQMITCSQNSRKQWIDNKIQFGCYHPTAEQVAVCVEVCGGDDCSSDDVSDCDLPF